jgi:hypothetical protein
MYRMDRDFAAPTGELHVEATGAEIAPKLLPEQQFNIGFVIHDKNEKAHARLPDSAMVAGCARNNDLELSELGHAAFGCVVF